jgi:hypothetical protein
MLPDDPVRLVAPTTLLWAETQVLVGAMKKKRTIGVIDRRSSLRALVDAQLSSGGERPISSAFADLESQRVLERLQRYAAMYDHKCCHALHELLRL